MIFIEVKCQKIESLNLETVILVLGFCHLPKCSCRHSKSENGKKWKVWILKLKSESCVYAICQSAGAEIESARLNLEQEGPYLTLALIDFKVFRCSATFLTVFSDLPHFYQISHICPPMLWAIIGVSGAGRCEWETMNCWSSLALIAVPRAIAIVFHHLTCILDESNLVTIDHYILCVSRCLDMVVALPSSSW